MKTTGQYDPALEPLGVIDRLEVGPVTVSARRATCPYRVIDRQGDARETELSYKYEQDVFDPAAPASINLAAMITAQPALNYGLFCDEIRFLGSFDAQDRRFLSQMAANTAREIYVKKFLEPNPFLTEEVRGLTPVKLKSYLRADLAFADPRPPSDGGPWSPGGRGVAVLSSGGKESLLSYGVLAEIGQEVHPVFINESGRHWFTALNAYRHFAAQVPTTARVWTDVDRLYAWMLRRLPFIREDFARVRSDEYPIRLWTVAGLVFGALPVLVARGLGRLVVGDEHDTTRQASFQGIRHYDGLFDQSIHFDRALSRYFLAKGWGVSQFSILRPLSEMLIEKVLVERYPDLQRLQVSCHAAHKEDDHVRPCGRCEKCRRVVGMLVALGADPTRCGYAAEEVPAILRRLVAEGSHQEPEGDRHTRFLLDQKGLVDLGDQNRASPGPGVLKLRFDPIRSPMEGIPRDLRRPLYRLFKEHAEGALKRPGRVWIEFDPLKDPALDHPYVFEGVGRPPGKAAAGGAPEPGDAAGPRSALLGELTWPQAGRRFKEVDLALLPVGAIEQHGLHLPLDTDAYDAERLALEAAEACPDPKPIVLPLIPYGVSYHHEDFPGTISVGPEILASLVYDIGLSVARHGVTKLVIVNGHGGNMPALHFAAQKINRDALIFTCVESGETSDADIMELIETPNDVHAGEYETSTALALRPELVRLEDARRFIPDFSIRFLNFTSRRSVAWYALTKEISPTGVLGDPTKADPNKGRRIWEIMVQRLVEFVEQLKVLTLDEIHQRRY